MIKKQLVYVLITDPWYAPENEVHVFTSLASLYNAWETTFSKCGVRYPDPVLPEPGKKLMRGNLLIATVWSDSEHI